jgi:hypothetical protein
MNYTYQLHVDAEKDYILLFLKKWYAYSAKEELIPDLEVEFYLSDSTKVTKKGTKKATRICVTCEDRRLNDLSIQVYVDRLKEYLRQTFVNVH